MGAGNLPALVELRLIDTFAGDDGVAEFASALTASGAPPLEVLALETCSLGGVGLSALVDA